MVEGKERGKRERRKKTANGTTDNRVDRGEGGVNFSGNREKSVEDVKGRKTDLGDFG
jgi:hypothetical protein